MLSINAFRYFIILLAMTFLLQDGADIFQSILTLVPWQDMQCHPDMMTRMALTDDPIEGYGSGYSDCTLLDQSCSEAY